MIICPAEMMKCVMQMQIEYLPKKYTSPFHAMKTIFRHFGLRSIYKGAVATVIRDCP